jgi:hypothetical protein
MKSNPTRAGPSLFGNPHPNSPSPMRLADRRVEEAEGYELNNRA